MSNQLENARLARSHPGWPVYRLKHLAQLHGGGTPSKENPEFWENGTIPWVPPKDMKRCVICESEDYITPEALASSATSYVAADSVLLVVRSGVLRHTLPVAISGDRVTLNQDMKALWFDRRVLATFMVYWFEGHGKDLLLEWRQLGATVDSIDVPRMMNARLKLPALETQHRIADFLDRETARIDLLIEKKQRLVALLEEKKESLVELAVTQGGPYTKLGHHTTILSGFAFPSAEFSSDPNDVRLLRGANISPGAIRWDEVVYWPRERVGEVQRFPLHPGDVVLGMDRPWISSGIRVAELTHDDAPSLLLQRVCRIEPSSSLNKQYMKLLLTSRRFLAYFEPILTGVSVPHISAEQIEAFRFPYVEAATQREVAAQCMSQLQSNMHLVSRIMRSVELLVEFRSTLITAAVTGQIDVDEWQRRETTDRRLDEIEEEMRV